MKQQRIQVTDQLLIGISGYREFMASATYGLKRLRLSLHQFSNSAQISEAVERQIMFAGNKKIVEVGGGGRFPGLGAPNQQGLEAAIRMTIGTGRGASPN